MAGDLDGIVVVSIDQAVAAPLAGRLLADAGARVIKVERMEGDFARRYDRYANGLSANFVWLNRGKESVCLDLKDEDDKALLARMIALADVFIQNLAPGAMGRMGLGSSALRERHPRLITCDISGYGERGPYRDMKAYDLLVQAESGLAYVNGIGENCTRVGVSVCDIAAGMNAAQSIFRALFTRERSGRGRGIEVSLFHSMGEWMNVPWLMHGLGGEEPPRLGLHHPSLAPYGAYGCGDGKALLISIQNEREWRSLCERVLGEASLEADPRFADAPSRVRNREALDRIINDAFARYGREELVALLEEAKIAYGRLSTLDDLRAHPQRRTVETMTSAGPIELLAPGTLMSSGEGPYGPVPELDQHGEAIRREFAA